MNRVVILACCFWCSALMASAQQITGQVRYLDTGQPAFNVLVKCDGTGGRSDMLTDRSGNFRFSVSPGHYVVSIHTSGYEAEERSVDLLDNNSTEYLFFRLKASRWGTDSLTASRGTLNAKVPVEAQKEFERAEAALSSNSKGGLAEGIRHLEKALSIYPDFVEAELKLGTAYMDNGQWEKAERALRKIVETDPTASNALFALGEVYLHQRKNQEAEKVLLQGLQSAEGSYQGHLVLARVYWEMAKEKDDTQARPVLEKAYDQVNQALKLNPSLAAAHLVKGNLLLRVRRAEDALKEFQEYLRLEPKGQFADQTRDTIEKLKAALNKH